MGKLGVSDSFGEVSVVTGDAITCSIITATSVELGSIDPDRVEGQSTKLLLYILCMLRNIIVLFLPPI